ncbi:MAG: sialidase family protein [Thermomicrobiales bacterium]
MHVRDEGIVFDAATAPEDCRSCAFTSMARLADGAVLVGFRNGSGRDAPDGRLRVMRSRDEGASWKTLHAGLTAVVDGVEGNLYAEADPALKRRATHDEADPALKYRATHDEVPPGLRTTEGSAPDGVLALPYESWKEYDDPSPGRHGAHLRISRDGGRSWPEIATVAADPVGRVFFWDQRIAVHPETGRMAAMFWTHDREVQQDIENHIAWGAPDGSTWTTPVPTGWRGQHREPIALGGERLAAVYVHRHDPPSLRAILSEDFGRSWQPERKVTFYASRVGAEAGTARALSRSSGRT